MPIDPERDQHNRSVLAAHGLDAVLCRLPENVLLTAGYWPISSVAFMLLPREGESTLIATDSTLDWIPDNAADRVLTFRHGILDTPDLYESVTRLLRDAVRASGLERAIIGLEWGFEAVGAGHTAAEMLIPAARTRMAVEAAAPAATLVDAADALHHACVRKTPREIDLLRHANAVAAIGLERFREMCEPGRREAEVAATVEAAIMTHGIGYEGAERVRAWAQLMTGTRSAEAYSLHPATSHRTIEAGDLCVLELATMVDGFWSDLTRTLTAGSPNSTQVEMYAAVTDAADAAINGARSGMQGEEVDRLARGAIEKRGFGPLFFHPTGHGLGFRYHEPHPVLRPGSSDLIEDGTVTSIEPGLYKEGFGGMRLEQNVVYHEDGVELLSLAATTLQ